MGEIIAGTYEIIQRIGAGGGGEVYLANHIRLNKQVVLKADKRKLTTSPVLLRREVDVLKDLNHPYIPHVYDFFVDGEKVYTAMDYIRGESLDQPLKRGERFSQAQIVAWSKQILDALAYLHSATHGDPPRGYVHSDIKPANLMCKPDGDICLIDFNIALAIGEENVVGSSPGYASPEHYGQDYTFSGAKTPPQAGETVLMDGETMTQTIDRGTGSTSGRPQKVIVPDARSDIYSLGATLYHLLSGKRPAKYAVDVEPLSEKEFDPQLARIINKAMEPNPEERYQTAEEMLAAFRGLRENDPRTKRFKRTRNVAAAVLAAALLAGAGMSFAGLRQMESAQAALAAEARAAEEAERLEKEALANIRSSETAYQEGNTVQALELSLRAMEAPGPYAAQAQKALTDALGVYELSDAFRSRRVIPLSAQPMKAALSPQGGKVAALVDGKMLVFDTSDGRQLAELESNGSALADVLFLDEDTLLYAGREGVSAYDLAAGVELWHGQPATALCVSADGATVAAVYKDESQARLYNAATGEALGTVEFSGRSQSVPSNDHFADPGDSLLAISGDGRWLAASFEGGGLRLFPTAGGQDVELYGSSGYTHFEGGFFDQYFAFSATREGESVFAVIDLKTMEQTGGFQSVDPFHVQADESGVYLSSANILVKLDPVSGEQTEVGYTGTGITAFQVADGLAITATDDGGLSFFDWAQPLDSNSTGGPWDFLCVTERMALAADRNRQQLWLFTPETHQDCQVAAYDPAVAHSEARLAPDGESVLLFRYDAVQSFTAQGEPIAQLEMPDAEKVYDQQYLRQDGKGYLEVTYADGRVLRYDARSCELVEYRDIVPPDESLYEEFFTDRYRVTSPLHGAPEAFPLEGGEAVADLTSEGYLTYVTQVGDYLITEYVTASGQRYGLLRDSQWAVLARLPGLCDITEDGMLIFDDGQGILRQSRIYSTQELTDLGHYTLKEETR